jgi:hypothetical protein
VGADFGVGDNAFRKVGGECAEKGQCGYFPWSSR